MSSGSRPHSPARTPAPPSAHAVAEAPSGSALALAPHHEHEDAATLTVPAAASPSPVPPTPPPKDALSSDHNRTEEDEDPAPEPEPELTPKRKPADPITVPAPAAMSKLGLKTAPPEMDEPDSPIVIDISGPVRDDVSEDEVEDEEGEGEEEELDGADEEDGEGEEAGMDTELTIRVDGEEVAPRASDTTEPHSGKHTDGGSTLYGSATAPGGEHVQEHPLRLDVEQPVSPPPWDKTRMGDDEAEYLGEVGVGGRSGLGGAKASRVHEFGNKSSHGRPLIPHSAYYFGPPHPDSAYGTDPVGQMGVHHPREIVRVERDYTGGELPQFTPTYPLELEGRITPTQFLETINAINEMLLSAHSLSHAFVDNALAYFTLQISRAVKRSHYEKEMDRLKTLIDELNLQMYNPVGLHIKWPRSAALLFLEIEYY